MKRARKLGEEAGQVIVEFLLVTAIIFTMIFLFVQMSWGIAWGHYVHYATYMASRAYLSAGLSQGEQVTAATAVLNQTLKVGGRDIFPFLSPARTGGDRDAPGGSETVPGAMVGTHPEAVGKIATVNDAGSRLYSWAEGVQYNFNLKMFLLPISKLVSDGGQGKAIRPGGPADSTKPIYWKGVIPFSSDSFLGREPSVVECNEWMRRLSGIIPRGDGAVFLEDNGC